MKTIEYKGKQYVAINERLKYLREKFAGYRLLSEIIDINETRCIIKAKLFNENNVEVANGIAYEDAGSTFINKTSYIENCETSAWGRCLANFGIGIDTDVASADEVLNASMQQEKIDYKIKNELEQITTVDDLSKYYHANKTKYADTAHEFNRAVTDRKTELLEQKNNNDG